MRFRRGDDRCFVSLSGTHNLVLAWGDLNDRGEQRFNDIGEARRAYSQMIASRTAAGYRCVATIRHPELESAVRADRDDDAAREVYADWLEQNGSPASHLLRGGTVVPETNGKARAALQEFDLPGPAIARFRWRNGLWSRLQIRTAWRGDTAECAHELFEMSLCGTLEELDIECLPTIELSAILQDARNYDWARDLGRLRIAAPVDPLEPIGELITRAFPRLRTLELLSGPRWEAPGFKLAGLKLMELQCLRLEQASRLNLAELPTLELPALDDLSCSVFDAERAAAFEVLKPCLLALRLRKLELRWADCVSEVLGLLPLLPLAARLETLAIAHSPVDDATVAQFVQMTHRFQALASLQLNFCQISPSSIALLVRSLPGIWHSR